MSRHAPTWSDGTGGGTALGDGAGPATCLPYVLAREAGSLPQYLPHECRRRRPALVPAWPTGQEGQGRRRHGGVDASARAARWQPGVQTQGIVCPTSLREAKKTKHCKCLEGAFFPARPRARRRRAKQPTSPAEQAGVLGSPCAPWPPRNGGWCLSEGKIYDEAPVWAALRKIVKRWRAGESTGRTVHGIRSTEARHGEGSNRGGCPPVCRWTQAT